MLLLIPTGILLVVSLIFNVAMTVTKKLYNRTAPAGRERAGMIMLIARIHAKNLFFMKSSFILPAELPRAGVWMP